jgi:hypothetical protein
LLAGLARHVQALRFKLRLDVGICVGRFGGGKKALYGGRRRPGAQHQP